ncbi:hypothetical protein F511_44410 [Dorcoceras hygrometricum]|uniref:Uncharacterized protein n=1 Tax=Dorcoceras hygrometricum TaxID=472368 RepID=A0A2Z6ZYG2_9LAMI|nr:hypothetical protein F511_44410 [Dorcoceras hygrometricum]
MLYSTCATFLDWSRRKDIQARIVNRCLSWIGRRYQAGTVRGRPNWFGSLLPEVQRTSSWFISWMLEQHEDQAQSLKSSSSAESRAELKCRVQAQNAQDKQAKLGLVTRIIEPSWLRSNQLEVKKTSWEQTNQLAYDICEKLDLTDTSTSCLATSWEWSKAGASKQLEEQERTEQAQLQTKRGADAEVDPKDQLEDQNKEAGEEKERALQELMKQPD